MFRAFQCKVTEESVESYRNIIDCVEEDVESITSLTPFEDGTHFFIAQQNKLSVYSTQTEGALYRFDIPVDFSDTVLSLSKDLFLICHEQPCFWLYSLQNPGHRSEINLDTTKYERVYKFKTFDNTIIVLHSKSLEIWKISEQSSKLVSQYEFQNRKKKKLAESLEIINENKIVVLLTRQWKMQLLLLRLKNLVVVSETEIWIKRNKTYEACEIICPNLTHTGVMLAYTRYSSSRNGIRLDIDFHSFPRKRATLAAESNFPDKYETIHSFIFYVPSLSSIIAVLEDCTFFKSKIDENFLCSMKYAEIRKNARILAQAQRTVSSIISTIPIELCLKIIALTDETISEMEGTRIARRYYAKPIPFRNTPEATQQLRESLLWIRLLESFRSSSSNP